MFKAKEDGGGAGGDGTGERASRGWERHAEGPRGDALGGVGGGGVNEGKALHARAVLDATAEDMLNLHYIIVDKDGRSRRCRCTGWRTEPFG